MTRRFVIPNEYIPLVILFVAILIIFSPAILINIETIQHAYRNFLAYMILIFIGFNLKLSKVDLNNIFRNLINFISIISFFCILTLLNDNFLWGGRVFGSLFGPNTAGTIFLLGLCLNFNNKLSFFVFFKDLLLMMALALTASFGAIISFVVFSILFFNKIALKKYILYFVFIMSLLILNIYFEIINISGFFSTFVNKFHAILNGDIFTIENRFAQHTQSLNSFLLNPLKFLIVNYEANLYITNDSLFLQIFNNHGILSLLLFLFFIFTIIQMLNKKINNVDASYIFKNRELFNYFENFLRFFIVFFVINCSITASLFHYPINCIVWLCTGLFFNFFSQKKNTLLFK